jgi:hypothetical protein
VWISSLPRILADGLASIFVIVATIDMTRSLNIRTRSHQWRKPRHFYRVMCVLQLFTALFFAVPQLQIWGVILAAFITSFRIVILRDHRQWNWERNGV